MKVFKIKLRINEPTLWLAVLLLTLPTLTNTTNIKQNKDSKNKTNDTQYANSFMTSNFNKQTKNESYLDGEDINQTNKENESIQSSTYLVNNDTINITTPNKVNKNDDEVKFKVINDLSKENNVEYIDKDGDSDNTFGIKIDHDQKYFNNKEPGVDGKLNLLLDVKDVDANSENLSKEDDKGTNNASQGGENITAASEIKVETREIMDAIDFGMKALEDLVNVKEPQWYKLGLFLDKNHPAAKVATFGAPATKKAILLSRFGYATLEASKKIAESYPNNVTKQSAGIPDELQSRIDIDSCPLRGKPICPPASKRFRTADGTCNNLKHPWWGGAMLPMERFLTPVYEDGIQSIRRSVFGDSLPSPRQISTVFHRDRNRETPSVTMMFTQWGQFLDHDVTSTVKGRSFNGSIPRCCDDGGRRMLPPDLLHPSCLPIEVPKNDPFLSRFGIRCMEFLRSSPSTRIDCELGWREQISQVTPYIDASTIYGSDVATSDSIRTFRKGQIIYGRPRDQGPLNPPDPPEGELCEAGALSDECLQPGDTRMSETPGLTAMHTMFVRYHNKVATVLAKINPHWKDERVYQETRRIVYSAIQHITYREYLPLVLGPEYFGLFDLRGYYEKYDKDLNPNIVNSFGTAAFRFGHSMVQNSIIRTDSNHVTLPNNVSLHEEISNFNNIWTFGSIDRLLLGFSNQPSQRRDEFIAEELTNHLFQFSDAIPFGMDLAAINIQRGRDHGIAPYTAWRKPCLMRKVRDWEDLEHHMSINAVLRLKTLYRHVDDIDLFTGGLAEKPVLGGVVGETFGCIIASQFSNLRRGDRFFYTNEGLESSFNSAQLQQLKNISLAQIICQTTDEVETIQPFVFLSADQVRNVRVSCESPEIGVFDLAAWTDKPFESNGISNNLDSFEKELSPNDKLDFGRQKRLMDRPDEDTKTKTAKDTKNIKPTNTNYKRLEHFLQFTPKLLNISSNFKEIQNRKTRGTDDTTKELTNSIFKSRRKTKRTTKTPPKRRPTTLKPFHITSVPMEVSYGNKPNKPTFTGLTFAKPTKKKPQYYQIQDQTHDDVTYLLGILPTHSTKAPPSASSVQVNINIHYSQQSSATESPVSPTKKKKHPPSHRPPTSDYTARPILTGTHTHTYGQNNVVLITKRPPIITKRPSTYQTTEVSYPVIIFNSLNHKPNNAYEVTTKNPTYLMDSYFVTTKKTKQPNLNGYDRPTDIFHRPSTGYFSNNDYDDDRYIPIETKPSTTYQTDYTPSDNVNDFDYHKKPLHILTSGNGGSQYSNRPEVFESKPFSSSKRPLSVISSGYNTDRYSTERPPNNHYYSDEDNDSDVITITNNKRRPQTTGYNRDEIFVNDHIFNEFFKTHDSTDEKTSYGNTKTKVDLNVDGKLDFKSRVVYKKTDQGYADTGRFVELSSVKREEGFEEDDGMTRKRINDSIDQMKKKYRRSVNKIRIVDMQVLPSKSRNRWKRFNATKELLSLMEVSEFPVKTPYSYKDPKPTD